MKQLYIVAAAGIGKRMGTNEPKQFLEIDEEPIVVKTLKVLSANENIDEILIVTNYDYVGLMKTYVEKFGIKKVRGIVEGGRERQDSIYNALMTIDNIENYIVGIQDGVRPFIKAEYIDKAKEMLEENDGIDGIVVGVPLKDTVKVVDKNNKVISTPNRSTLMAAQTPQVFKGEVLVKAYKEAAADSYIGTDDSSLVERIGGNITFIEGSYDNVKITTVEDLLYFQKRG